MMCCMEESPCEFKAEEFPQGEERREMRQITSEIRGREKGLKGDGNNPKCQELDGSWLLDVSNTVML